MGTKRTTRSGSSPQASSGSANAASPSLAAWQARTLHTITLPSGQRVRIRIPGVATLIEKGDLPDELLTIALLELTTQGGATAAIARDLASENGDREKALEQFARYGELQRHLVSAAVVAVETAPDVFEEVSLAPDSMLDGSLPEDDLAMVSEIVQRIRFRDARGVRIGVEPLDRWAMFREAHGCPDEDCPGCQKLVDSVSTADVGAL